MDIFNDFTTFITLIYLKQLCLQVTCQLHQQAAHYPWITLLTTLTLHRKYVKITFSQVKILKIFGNSGLGSSYF